MLRRVFVVGFLIAAALSVVAPAPAQAAPRLGTTSLPPERPAKYSSQALPSPSFPYADTFKLHSRAGAQRVIYLDFNGENVSGTQWNTDYTGGNPFNAVAYDFDGNAASFSNGELAVIQATWQRVAEDFAPFAVDVTTEDPGLAAIDRSGSGDLNYGTRALITNTGVIYDGCQCAGVAFIGVFDAPAPYHQKYQPALIFGQALGPYDKDLADSISHEVGHNLGLEHDGKGGDDYYLGQGAWAPIMGAGYYRPITQWSKGEYTGATTTEDDFAVMQQYGAPLRADDHGNTTASATALGASTNGVIETDADTDVFAFSAPGGPVTITASPAARGANLDIKLELLDAAGNVVATDNPPSSQPNNYDPEYVIGLGASLTTSLVAGPAFVRVQGVGAADPLTTGYSGYGSVGAYSVTSTLPTLPLLSIGDVAVSEGNSGNYVTMPVSLSAPSPTPVTFIANTVDGTALSYGADPDYTYAWGALVTIPAGATSVSLSQFVMGDDIPEPHEKFSVVLTTPVGAVLADATGVATLINDDGIGISINNVTKYEGAAGTYTTYSFTISLSTVPSWTIGVTASTINWSALAPSDYFAKSQTLTFLKGQKTKTFNVTVRGDNLVETGEKFFVKLTNPTGSGARITMIRGYGLIRSDD